jgi:NADH:ubiquinone oxidoreductase subunit K
MDVITRVTLGLVLLAAAAGKVRAWAELPDVLGGYGIPVALRRAFAILLVSTEAVLGALLVAGAAVRPTAYAALGLGVAFALALARLRARGIRRLRCGCFGPGERSTSILLARALGLTALAGLTVLAAELELGTPSGDTMILIALAALAAAVALLAVLVLALYRQVGVLSLRLGPRAALELAEEGPEIGRPAPPLSDLARRGAELVAFFSENCRLCRELAPGVRALGREGLRVHVVSESTDPEVFAAWTVPGTPFVVHVIDGAVVAKGSVNTLEQLDHVIALGRARRGHAAA